MSISQPYYPLPFFLFSPFSLVFPREPLEGIGKVTYISFVVSTHALLLIFFSHCSNNPIEYSFEVNQFPLFQFEAQKEEEEEETRATPFFSLSLSLSSCLPPPVFLSRASFISHSTLVSTCTIALLRELSGRIHTACVHPRSLDVYT